MSVIATALKHMLAAGMDHEFIIAAVAEMENSRPIDEQAARRRTADRDRKRASRLRKSADSAENADTPAPDKEKSPKPPKEINPTPKPSSLRSEGRARAHRMPDDFEPDLNFAIDKGLTHSEARAEVERMRDWSKSSPNGKKLDWPATWRGWISRKADERRPASRAPPQRQSAFQSHQDDVRRELDSVINGNRSRDDEFTGHTIDH